MRARRARRSTAALALAAFFVAGAAVADEDSVRPPLSSSRAGPAEPQGLADVIRAGGIPIFPSLGRVDDPFANGEADTTRAQPLLGTKPAWTLVARDWAGTQLLRGDHVSLTDQLRLSRSTRMVVMRVSLADSRFSPFMQIGLGEWRIDTELVPVLPHDTEPAAQRGGGWEIRVAKRWRVGLELDYTVLYREQHEPQMISGPRLLSGYLATRISF